MRRPSLAAVAAVALALGAALSSAASASAAGDPILPLWQVQAGMRCTGYSVVRGTAISSFDVEVLDVVDGDPEEDGPRILVQVSGPAVDATGIGPGFSGSPIYCRDGAGVDRNIGAISESIGEYGGKVVLATPIEAILSAKPDAPREQAAAGGGSRAHASRALHARAARAERRLRRKGSRPLTGPLTISGVSGPLGRALEAAGRRAGRPVLAAPAGPLGWFPPQPLRPGSAVAVGYSTGDLRLSAIGTVAYTDDDAVWAFGHPFEGAGARSLLLQDAYVFHVVNDPTGINGGSYKLSAPGHTLGTLTNDALDAVVGRVGAPPRTIPIRVHAHDLDTANDRTVRVDAASETEVDDPTGGSPLTQVAPLAILQGGTTVLGAAPGRLSATMCLKVSFVEGDRVARFCNRYASSGLGFDFGLGGNGVALSAALDAFDALGLIDGFEGPPPHVRRVDATLAERRGERVAALRDVHAPKRVSAGHRVRLRLQLQRLRSTAFSRTVTVRLPRHLRPGKRTLDLYGADSGSSGDALVELLYGNGRRSRGPATLDKLVRQIDAFGRYDGIEGRIAGKRFRVYRDTQLLITGHTSVKVRVRGKAGRARHGGGTPPRGGGGPGLL